MQRDLRLLRLQTDNLASRVGTLDQRVATLEQAIHGIISEMGRGFGQQQQQIARLEKRIDAVDAGLTGIREELAASEARIIAAIRAG